LGAVEEKIKKLFKIGTLISLFGGEEFKSTNNKEIPTRIYTPDDSHNHLLLLTRTTLMMIHACMQDACSVGDIPNRYISDVVLNQQVRVVHQGGMADCLPGGPVAGKTMAVLDAGAHGGSADKPMAGCLVVHA
jgi:hypothetical protein